MVEVAPSSIEVQDFQFKLHSKLKVFDYVEGSEYKNATDLVVAASRYGLVFVGTPKATIEVVFTKSIESCPSPKIESTDFNRRSILLPSIPTHLSLNCDCTLLAVIVTKDGCATALIYNVLSFYSQNVHIVREIRVSATPNVFVLQTCWNPALPSVYTVCKGDGSLGVYDLKENSVEINEIPTIGQSTSFCWSPKGKQIVVGSANGSLTQYKPDLKAVKSIQPPALTGTGPFFVINVFWISNYQFMAVYRDASDSEARPVIVIVNSSKAGPVNFINYDDICYDYGNMRPSQCYISYQNTWGVLILASANSMDVGVLGSAQTGDPVVWKQWNLLDSARAELPLAAHRQETFPLGIALDTAITHQLPWGDNQTLPPMPMLHIISHYGLLCSFSVINIMQGAATICNPPEPVPDQSGLSQFIIPQKPTETKEAPKPTSTPMTPQFSGFTSPAMAPAAVTQVQMVTSVSVPPISSNLTASMPISTQPMFKSDTPFLGTTLNSSTAMGTFATTVKSPSQPITSAPSLFGSTLNFNPSATLPFTPVTSSNLFSSSFKPDPVATAPAVGTSSSNTFSFVQPADQFSGEASSPNTSGSIFGGLLGSTNNAGGNKNSMFAPMTTGSIFGGLATVVTKQSAVSIDSSKLSSASLQTETKSVQNLTFTPSTTGFSVPKPNQITFNASQSLTTASETSLPQESKSDVTVSRVMSLENYLPQKEEPDLSDRIIGNAIDDEVKNFNKELQDLIIRCKNINLNVGSDEEKNQLVKPVDALLAFYEELQETTDSQVVEVHYLKQALIQSFAWYEDAKSRHQRFIDPNFSTLLMSQELDPVSEKQLADIQHLIYYISSQLKLIDGTLDNQWADFQDSCKKQVKGRLIIPTMEPIYQSMVRINAILARQRYVLKDIGNKMKIRNKHANAFPHVMNLSLKKINGPAEVELQLRKLKIEPLDIFASRYEKVVQTEKKYTTKKEEKLSSFFSNRSILHISPKKPKFSSSLSSVSKLYESNRSKSYNAAKAQQSLSFNNTTEINDEVETNLSSSNVFSFALSPNITKSFGLSQGKKQIPVQEELNPQTPDVSNLKTTSTEQVTPVTTPSTALKHDQGTTFAFTVPTSTTSSPFSMVPPPATNFTVKQQISSNVVTKPITFNTDVTVKPIATKPQSTVSAPNSTMSFKLGSNITITPISAAKIEMKTPVSLPKAITTFTQPKSTDNGNIESEKITLDFKTSSAKMVISQPEIKTEPTKPIFTSNMPVATNTFIIQPPKTVATKDDTPVSSTLMFKSSSDTAKLDLSNTLNFGTHLNSGQISTPKPKSALTLTSEKMPTSTVSTAQVTKPKVSFAMPHTSTQVIQPPAITTSAMANKAVEKEATVTSTPSTETTVPSTATSIFGMQQVTSAPPIFGQPLQAQTTATSFASDQSKPVTTSFFGQGTSVFQQPPATPLFTAPTTSPTTTTTSILGQALAAPVSSSFFGLSQTTTSTTASTEQPQPTTPLFGQSPMSGNSLFGSQTSTPFAQPQTSSSLFTGASTASSLFAPKTTASVAANNFSFTPPSTSSARSGSIFGNMMPTTPVSTPFGGISVTSTQSTVTLTTAPSSVTSTSPITTTTSIFGTPTTSAETSKAATFEIKTTQESFGFGSLAVSSSSDPNKFSFGNLTVSALSPTTSTVASTPGTVAATNTFSFALPASTTQSSGYNNSNSNIFAKAVTTTASTFIGQPICSPSTFGQNSGPTFGQSTGNIFAQKSTTSSSSIFGQGASSQSLFGNTTATTTTSIFGQNTGNIFNNPATTSTGGSIFGQNTTFGAMNTTSAPTGSIFGANAFTNPTTTTSSNFSFIQNTAPAFGSSGGSLFGSKPTFGQAPAFVQPPAFGSSPFGSPTTGGNIFGNTSPQQTQQSPGTFGSGFGAPPSFGSPPAFGQSAFGAPPIFGGSPKGFGSGTNTSAFGGTIQENSTFANLANQSTLGFGSLAQGQATSPPAQMQQFSGGAQFSSWR